jgi:hypothetical protein
MKYFLIISPYTDYIGGSYGKGESIAEAMKNAGLKPSKPRPYILYGCDHNDFGVTDMGGLRWRGEAPTVIENTIENGK